MKRWLSTVIVTALSIPVFAAGSSGSAVPSSCLVDSWDQMVRVDGNWANPDGCGTSSFVILQMSNANYKDYLATILAAGTAQKQLNFWLSGCTSTPWGGSAPLVMTVTIGF
jgi:hypothetical protein